MIRRGVGRNMELLKDLMGQKRKKAAVTERAEHNRSNGDI